MAKQTNNEEYYLIESSDQILPTLVLLNTNFIKLDKTILIQKAALGIAEDTFSATKTYAVGELVVKDGKLYECTTVVTTAGAWDSTKWEEVELTTLDDIESRLSEFENEKVALTESEFEALTTYEDKLYDIVEEVEL